MFFTIIFIYSLILATASGSDIAVRSVPLPSFMLHLMLVTDNSNGNGNMDIDLNAFRTHVEHATTKHLTIFLKKSFEPEHGDDFLKGVHLDSTLRQYHTTLNATDPRAEINVSFEGTLTVLDVGQMPAESEIHALLQQAFEREDYWKLIRRFVEDPVLETIDYVEILMSEPSSRTQSSSGTSTNPAAVAAVVVFSLVFAVAVGALVYLAYRKYRVMKDMCCSQSKVSESTDDEDDGGEEEFEDEVQGNVVLTIQRKKKHRVKTVERTSSAEIHSLDSIQEEGDDEDGMTNIPLDREPRSTIV